MGSNPFGAIDPNDGIGADPVGEGRIEANRVMKKAHCLPAFTSGVWLA